MIRRSELESSNVVYRSRFVSTSRHPGLYYLSKRIIDVFVSMAALILLSPFMLLIAVLIRLDSPGSAIYTQKRVGSKRRKRNGHLYWEQAEFSFYKFRTMVKESDSSLHKAYIKALINHDEDEIRALNNPDSQLKKLVSDPRITRMGYFLRRSSLDELPQFWNILRGEMSLVGPRPAIPYEVEMYKPWYFRRFDAQPGLTGLWQVIARNSVDFDTMVRYDIEYAENQSLWQDLKLLLMTPMAIIIHRSAA